jgi:5S rRNA maturation endonuclease (ribonuclease M5)
MNIKQIKEKYTCLDWLGDKVVKKTSRGYLARCPWKEDKNPSLTVTLDGKGWHDLSDGSHGNLIDMVQRCLNTTDFSRVCAAFGTVTPFSFHQPRIFDKGKEKDNGFAFCDIVPLQNRVLYAYLGARCINTIIAKRFLKEAHYGFEIREDGRYLFALAYGNDIGGYELRGAPNKANADGFKGGMAPKGITTHLGRENAATVVFEGFMDMLSWVTMTDGVKHNLIVMNSVTNKEETVEVLRSISGTIYLCLDNDKAGEEATRQMLEALPSAVDIRSRFAPAKDVNEYLCKTTTLSGSQPNR